MIISQRRAPFWDEADHISQADAFVHAASLDGWLKENDRSAPGPLCSLLHYSLSLGVGHLSGSWLRLPNYCMLLVVISVLAVTLSSSGIENRWTCAGAILGIPMSWVISGMALTEIPAMVGIGGAFWAAFEINNISEQDAALGKRRVLWSLLLAMSTVVALCGRQTYLVTLPGIWLIAARDRTSSVFAAFALLFGTLPILAVFFVWGGMVPSKLAWVGGHFRINQVVYALCYLGMITLLLAPRFLWNHRKWGAIGALIAVVFNVITGSVSVSVMTSVKSVLGLSALSAEIDFLTSQLMVAAGAAFLCSLLDECRIYRDRRTIGLGWCLLALCGTSLSVVHFSSRHIAMAIPIAVLFLSRYFDFGPMAVLRLSVGAAAGAASLWSYYSVW